MVFRFHKKKSTKNCHVKIAAQLLCTWIFVVYLHFILSCNAEYICTKSVFDTNEMAQWTILSRIFHVHNGSSNRSTSVATVWVAFVKWDCSSFMSLFIVQFLFVVLFASVCVFYSCKYIWMYLFNSDKQVHSQTHARSAYTRTATQYHFWRTLSTERYTHGSPAFGFCWRSTKQIDQKWAFCTCVQQRLVCML